MGQSWKQQQHEITGMHARSTKLPFAHFRSRQAVFRRGLPVAEKVTVDHEDSLRNQSILGNHCRIMNQSSTRSFGGPTTTS